MIAVDEDYNTLEGVRTFPGTFLATQKPRKVTMRVPQGTWAVCARTVNPVQVNGDLGAGVNFETCARVNPQKLAQGNNLSFRPTQTGGRLRGALVNPDLTVIQEGQEGF